MTESFQPHGLVALQFLCPWNSVGKNTGVGFIPFSKGSSPPGGRTWVSQIAGRFSALTSLVTALSLSVLKSIPHEPSSSSDWDTPLSQMLHGSSDYFSRAFPVTSESKSPKNRTQRSAVLSRTLGTILWGKWRSSNFFELLCFGLGKRSWGIWCRAFWRLAFLPSLLFSLNLWHITTKRYALQRLHLYLCREGIILYTKSGKINSDLQLVKRSREDDIQGFILVLQLMNYLVFSECLLHRTSFMQRPDTIILQTWSLLSLLTTRRPFLSALSLEVILTRYV